MATVCVLNWEWVGILKCIFKSTFCLCTKGTSCFDKEDNFIMLPPRHMFILQQALMNLDCPEPPVLPLFSTPLALISQQFLYTKEWFE